MKFQCTLYKQKADVTFTAFVRSCAPNQSPLRRQRTRLERLQLQCCFPCKAIHSSIRWVTGYAPYWLAAHYRNRHYPNLTLALCDVALHRTKDSTTCENSSRRNNNTKKKTHKQSHCFPDRERSTKTLLLFYFPIPSYSVKGVCLRSHRRGIVLTGVQTRRRSSSVDAHRRPNVIDWRLARLYFCDRVVRATGHTTSNSDDDECQRTQCSGKRQ